MRVEGFRIEGFEFRVEGFELRVWCYFVEWHWWQTPNPRSFKPFVSPTLPDPYRTLIKPLLQNLGEAKEPFDKPLSNPFEP